ncbi:MAG TPA: sigma-70 family RNA polymerase sigma factor [Candidatus Hydrogenedentes bacterium]|nr:sigma-70 family RNA polymerase sigma factor [Candidatus Hydrogenedentota bacterium]HIJ73038.1 sigma-70 family RNA polymerase sigma factor [Candidatus Hydrogenedentota bacterium]
MTRLSPDIVLLDRWRSRRDAEAFNEIVFRYGNMVYATCKRILKSESGAQDVTQECFLKLAQSRTKIRGSLPGWLHTLATHRSLDFMKSEARRRERERRFSQAAQRTSEISWSDVESYVDEAIEELPPGLRSVILACFLDHQTHEEAARSLGISRRTVGYRVKKGIEQIRGTLKKRGIPVGSAFVAAALGSNLAEAAPAALMQSLGKIGIAGLSSPTMTVATGSAQLAAGVLGGALLMKKIVVCVVVVIVAGGALLFTGLRTSPERAELAAPVSTERVAQTELPGTQEDLEIQQPPAEASLPETPQDEEPPDTSVTDFGAITGRVVDANGCGLPGAQVLLADRRGRQLDSVSSGEDGTFRFVGAASANMLYLSAKKDERLSSPLGPFNLTTDGLNDVTITVYPPGSVAGTVEDTSGAPFADVIVGARPYHDNTERHHQTDSSPSDKRGRFKIAGLYPARYRFSIGVKPQERSSFPIDAAPVDVAPGEHVRDVILVLERQTDLTISGYVLDGQGQPVVGAVVMWVGPGAAGDTKTDEQGYYETGSLAEGDYDLWAGEEGYTWEQQRDIPSGSEEANFVIEKKLAINGRVVQADTGAAVASFEVGHLGGVWESLVAVMRWQYSWERLGLRQVKHEEGRFRIEDVKPGAATVFARAKGFAPGRQAVTLLPGEAIGELVIRLERDSTVEGIVRDVAGAPIRDAQVFVGVLPTMRNRDALAAARTSADGSFRVDGLSSAPQELFASHPDYAPGWTRVDPDSSSHTQRTEIVLSEGGRVEGTVLYDGQPHEPRGHALIYFDEDDEYMPPVTMRLEPDGSYGFDHVPAGEILVKVQVNPGTHTMWFVKKWALVANGKRTQVHFDIASGNASLEGTIHFVGPSPPQACVKLYMDTAAGATEMQTNVSLPSGHYGAVNLPSGTVDIEVIGYEPGGGGSWCLHQETLEMGDGDVMQKDITVESPER